MLSEIQTEEIKERHRECRNALETASTTIDRLLETVDRLREQVRALEYENGTLRRILLANPPAA